MNRAFDILVVGGGHAGCEAAAVAARMGARVALVSFARDTIGAMSCNPAIGGLGKGHLVREVDAFDGLIGKAADAAAIHYRMLNASKGAAVQGPRVQADRRLFKAAIHRLLDATPNLTIIEGEAAALRLSGACVTGLDLADGTALAAGAVILATGTFLGGRLFCGEERSIGGRVGERSAMYLGEQLRALDLPITRLKTGTPPRLDGRTIDWARLAAQPSDGEANLTPFVPNEVEGLDNTRLDLTRHERGGGANDDVSRETSSWAGAQWTMSVDTPARAVPQLFCAITRTNAQTHAIIRASLDRSPLFTGAIEAAGPRYCPSIEDKIHRFGDRDGHQVFLEPEGLDTHLVYPNGISTSLPADVQIALVRSLEGLERCEIVTPGYAVEYDHIDPRALDHRLAVRGIYGLFCAGQINGTTGYEEAAAQGLVAGIAAARTVRGEEPVTLDRISSYIGVMIDDLVLQGVSEPYRMLTARAEYRLRLRADNAETRLSPLARDIGALSPRRIATFEARDVSRETSRNLLARTAGSADFAALGIAPPADGVRRTLGELLRFPDVDWTRLAVIEPALADLPHTLVTELVEDAHYAPYLARQDAEIREVRANERIRLDATIDYRAIGGLSNEMVERLNAARPETLAEAGRVRGVTPAALSAILIHSRRNRAA